MKQTVRTCLLPVLLIALMMLAACARPKLQPQEPEETQNPAPAVQQGDASAPIVVQAPQNGGVPTLPTLERAPETDADTLTVLFINVRKADAILVQYGGKSALIDTGTEESAPHLLGALNFMGVDALDALFLTHTHKDHIGGVLALAERMPVAQAYAAQYSENKKNGENRITEAAHDAGIPLARLFAGYSVPLFGDAAFEVLGPLVYNDNDDNDNSLVLRLDVNGRTLLFTGDMQFAEEETLLSSGADVSADVLKVGNHGNPDATGDDFGRAVAPSVAVISTDTSEDSDSANPRVYAALNGAAVHVTQDTALGVLLCVGPDGTVTLNNAAPQRTAAELELTQPNRDTQTLSIINHGGRLDISGWMLQSERGGELLTFPDGSAIAAGATATVVPEGGAGDFVFTGVDAPWHKKKADTAILYDRFGFELARS